MGTDTKGVKYAGELVSIKRPNLTLSITDCLHPITESDEEPYIGVLNKKSIFFMSLLKVKEKEAASANIPIDDFFDIVDNTQQANRFIFEEKNGLGKAAAVINEAGPVKANRPITMGKFRGKSPAELLIGADDPESMAEELKSHAAFLAANVAKYPANQEGIDSINEAIDLYYKGELKCDVKETSSVPGRPLEIYSTPVKYWARKKDDKGNTKCYQLSVTCNPSNKYPYHMECTNFYAPVGQNANGTTPIYADKMVEGSKVTVTVDLSKSEWNMLIGKLQLDLMDAHTLWYPEMRTQDDINHHSYTS